MKTDAFVRDSLLALALCAMSLPGCGRREGAMDIRVSLQATPGLRTPMRVAVARAGDRPGAEEPASRPGAVMAAELARALGRVPGVQAVPFAGGAGPSADGGDLSDEALARHVGRATGAKAIALVTVEKFQRVTDEEGARQTDATFRVRILPARTGRCLVEGTADVRAEGGYQVRNICRQAAEAVAADLREHMHPAGQETE